MSLNKFTGNALDPETKKEWMNINCNAVNGTEMYRNGIPLNPSGIYAAINPLVSLFSGTMTDITGNISGSTIIPNNFIKEGSCFNVRALFEYDRSTTLPTYSFYLANSDRSQIYWEIVNENPAVLDSYLFLDVDINIIKIGTVGTSVIHSTAVLHERYPAPPQPDQTGTSMIPFFNTTTYNPSTEFNIRLFSQLNSYAAGTSLHVLSLTCTQKF